MFFGSTLVIIRIIWSILLIIRIIWSILVITILMSYVLDAWDNTTGEEGR